MELIIFLSLFESGKLQSETYIAGFKTLRSDSVGYIIMSFDWSVKLRIPLKMLDCDV